MTRAGRPSSFERQQEAWLAGREVELFTQLGAEEICGVHGERKEEKELTGESTEKAKPQDAKMSEGIRKHSEGQGKRRDRKHRP